MKPTGRLAFVAIASILLSVPTSSVAAAVPLPSERSADHLVAQVDTTYGFEVLRPATWTTNDLGDRREFVAPDGENATVAVAVTNFGVLAARSTASNSLVAAYELFRQHPSASGWTRSIEGLWEEIGITYSVKRDLDNGAIYNLGSAHGAELVAFVISDGQPLGLTLQASGDAGDLTDYLAEGGFLADFEAMIASAKPHQTAVTVGQAAPQATALVSPAMVDTGPWNSSSGYVTVGASTYRMQDSYYQAPPKVYWLYEYLYYSLYQIHGWWLYSTSVTDSPQYSCLYGSSWDLVSHSIGKPVSPSNGIAVDSYYPNVIVAHLNPTTAHTEVYGDPLNVNCMWYFPYTH